MKKLEWRLMPPDKTAGIPEAPTPIQSAISLLADAKKNPENLTAEKLAEAHGIDKERTKSDTFMCGPSLRLQGEIRGPRRQA